MRYRKKSKELSDNGLEKPSLGKVMSLNGHILIIHTCNLGLTSTNFHSTPVVFVAAPLTEAELCKYKCSVCFCTSDQFWRLNQKEGGGRRRGASEDQRLWEGVWRWGGSGSAKGL